MKKSNKIHMCILPHNYILPLLVRCYDNLEAEPHHLKILTRLFNKIRVYIFVFIILKITRQIPNF